MDLQQLESNIKKYLLPYNSFLKITKIGDTVDIQPIVEEVPVEDEFEWRALESECIYPEQ